MADTFPTLTGSAHSPRPLEYIETASVDPTIRSPKEAGYVQTRARFSRLPMLHHVIFRGITEADKDSVANYRELRCKKQDQAYTVETERDARGMLPKI